MHEREASFEAMYRAEAPHVYRYCRLRVGADHAEDAVAEVFGLAWQKLDATPDHPRAWLLAAARRITANHIRARTRQALSIDPADLGGDFNTADLELAEQRHVLIHSLRKLPARDREAILLVTWHDLSNADAASVLGCSANALNVRLHRARRQLARILSLTEPPTTHHEGIEK